MLTSYLRWSAAGAAAVLIIGLAACSSGAASSGTTPGLATGVASRSPVASASAEATPDVTSTTLPGASSPPAGSISVVFAGPPLRFEPSALSAPAGDLSFALSNTSRAVHNLAIGLTQYVELATSRTVAVGATAVFSVHGLPPGRYVIWCTVDGHAAEGMIGTLTVR